MKIYLDGKYLDRSEAKISVFDHGFLYGDGVFEGIRCYDGCIFRLREHLLRLYRSARGIRLTIPLEVEAFEEVIAETVRQNEKRDAYIRVIVSRGEGYLGLSPRKCPKPTVVVIVSDITLYPEEMYRNGMAIITAVTRRTPSVCLDPQIKSLNYLNNILAKCEGEHAGYEEIIMLNLDGYVVEGSGDNIFIFRDGLLQTPPAHLGALRGITRGCVLELAEELGIPSGETFITRQELYTADECFLTGTAAEIVPVNMVDGRPIGDGKPGEITNRLLAAFRSRVKTDGYAVYAESAKSARI